MSAAAAWIRCCTTSSSAFAIATTRAATSTPRHTSPLVIDAPAAEGEPSLDRTEIETMRAKGAHYLVFSATSRGALDGDPELRKHLEARYRCLADREDFVLYELTGRRARPRKTRSH